MNNYPNSHPLHDRDAEWISARAEHVAGFNTALMTESYAALAHEYRRLKATEDKLSAANARIFALEATAGIRKNTDLALGRTTPTQTDLSRIAAALEVIANAH